MTRKEMIVQNVTVCDPPMGDEQKGMLFITIFATHSPFLPPSFFRREEKWGKE